MESSTAQLIAQILETLRREQTVYAEYRNMGLGPTAYLRISVAKASKDTDPVFEHGDSLLSEILPSIPAKPHVRRCSALLSLKDGEVSFMGTKLAEGAQSFDAKMALDELQGHMTRCRSPTELIQMLFSIAEKLTQEQRDGHMTITAHGADPQLTEDASLVPITGHDAEPWLTEDASLATTTDHGDNPT